MNINKCPIEIQKEIKRIAYMFGLTYHQVLDQYTLHELECMVRDKQTFYENKIFESRKTVRKPFRRDKGKLSNKSHNINKRVKYYGTNIPNKDIRDVDSGRIYRNYDKE